MESAKIKNLAIIFFLCYLVSSCFASKVSAENDTATTTNILPNAGTTSSSRDAFDLDGRFCSGPTSNLARSRRRCARPKSAIIWSVGRVSLTGAKSAILSPTSSCSSIPTTTAAFCASPTSRLVASATPRWRSYLA